MKIRNAKRAKCTRYSADIALGKQLRQILARAIARAIDEAMCRALYRIYKSHFDSYKAFLDIWNKTLRQAAEMKEQP